MCLFYIISIIILFYVYDLFICFLFCFMFSLFYFFYVFFTPFFSFFFGLFFDLFMFYLFSCFQKTKIYLI